MSDTDHSERRESGGKTRPVRFEVRENQPPRRPPQPIRNARDPFEDLSVGPRSASRPATALQERAQPKRPAISARPVAEPEPRAAEPPIQAASKNMRRAWSMAESDAYDRGYHPAYAPRASVMDIMPRGPVLAALISAVCVAVLYFLWAQPSRTRLSTFAGGREAPPAVADVNPADYPQLPTAAGESSVVGPPTISAADVDAILAEYGSPAAGTGAAWVEFGKQYKIDPAYAVAFFIHESSAGTNPGWAGIKPDGSTTHNVGNIICAGYPTCFNRFRDYPSWEAGIEDWYKLIAVEYISGRGAHTVEQIIPIYAPSFENNVPAYVEAVNSLVHAWRQGARR